MAVWYLDNDDEITDAVARLRGTDDEHVVFVVPPGSRIATGRLNFKLLAKEADSRHLAMAIASPDEQVRALATSAGVLVAVTPDEAQAALERGDEPAPAGTPPSAPVASATAPGAAATETPSGLLMWRSQRVRVATVIVLVIAIVLGYAALQLLPTAQITLQPRVATLEPVHMAVTASTTATEVDAEAGAIPAVVVPIELSLEDAYEPGGVETIETQASGEVVFSSPDQEFDQEIVDGTRVYTQSGTEFQTTETVVLPRTDGPGSAEVIVAVEALVAGDEGNVDAGQISEVPSLEGQGISVINLEAMSGGRFEETPVILLEDYESAQADLKGRLDGELKAYLRDPANTPAGLTVFTETARLGPVDYQPPAADLLGSNASSFTLSGSVVAEVLAVDEALVDEVLQARMLSALPEGLAVVTGTASVEHEEGRVDGEDIIFEGTASASSSPLIDSDELLDQVAGLPVSEAQAILEAIGTTTVSVWPDFLSDLPDDRERITLDVIEASTTE